VLGILLGALSPLGAGPSGAASSTRANTPTSIVQLGDSIGSGEGTLYDFTFNAKTGSWSKPGTPDPTWLGPYPACHQSPDAYGHVLATQFKGARFTQLACTGATFEKGIAGPWSATVPAEFGNLDQPSTLNPTYTKARPNLVLVTLGADDVRFVQIVSTCAEYTLLHPLGPTQCTASSPNGPDNVIKNDFIDSLPALEQHLTTLAGWIEQRGAQLGVRPKIVFTTYPDPLPDDAPAGGRNFCPDTWLFTNDQLDYYSSLVPVLDQHIATTINHYAASHHDKNITVVNLVNAFNHHRWCARTGRGAYVTPDAYGLSIYHGLGDLLDPNPAAFHPTPTGQRVIAQMLKPAVGRLFSSH
jgi:lysophospholipase L1-like esterase